MTPLVVPASGTESDAPPLAASCEKTRAGFCHGWTAFLDIEYGTCGFASIPRVEQRERAAR